MPNILEPDKTSRNLSFFALALFLLLVVGGLYYTSNRGCARYTEFLKTCTPYKCEQRIMGFESKYAGQTAITLGREIIGIEEDPYYASKTCNVIEIDDTSKNEKLTCKYSSKTREIVLYRAGILFGSDKLPIDESKPRPSSSEARALRATYAVRVKEQEEECGR